MSPPQASNCPKEKRGEGRKKKEKRNREGPFDLTTSSRRPSFSKTEEGGKRKGGEEYLTDVNTFFKS